MNEIHREGSRGVQHGGVQVISCPTRPVEPGTTLSLMVLADGPEGCAAVDISSGALVRAHYPRDPAPVLEPFDVARAVIAADPDCPDPTQPDAVPLEAPPERVGRVRRRQARRLVTPLLLPPGEQPFGFAGSAAQYWTVPGDRPSLALMSPQRPAAVRVRGEGGVFCRFGWGSVDLELPVADPLVRRAATAGDWPVLSGAGLRQALGFDPALLVLALSAPQDGRCYKVVAGFLPQP